MNYAILFAVIVLAIVAGQMLTQSWLLARAKRRHKRAKREPQPRPKSEPQSIEFNMVLSGVDEVEVGLARIRAVIEQIAEAAGGVPITVNNYYEKSGEPASVEAQSRIVARFAHPEAMEPQHIDCYAVGADQLRATAQELERMAADLYDGLDNQKGET